ncbi:hypothetical protein OUZ56_028111 [Daphnia magna]|uniref:Uncharacterized protein n=1 Tax=Daphnia magna TaxID=35525 RepID=A0ABR0B2W5_9CRUS|nr:hypothetical protein OUZ56_028111 [Daphnia magna]
MKTSMLQSVATGSGLMSFTPSNQHCGGGSLKQTFKDRVKLLCVHSTVSVLRRQLEMIRSPPSFLTGM